QATRCGPRPLACSSCWSMVVVPVQLVRLDEGLDGVRIAGRVAFDLAAFADALVGLDVRAGRDFLQGDLDWLGAFGALEGQEAGGFGHGIRGEWIVSRKTDIPAQAGIQVVGISQNLDSRLRGNDVVEGAHFSIADCTLLHRSLRRS